MFFAFDNRAFIPNYFSMNTLENGIDRQEELKSALEKIVEDEQDSIRTHVAMEALSREDIECFFRDLFYGGCISGMVSSLIYYKDTHSFYDKYYYEIEELRQEWEEMNGEPLKVQNDWKIQWLGLPLSK
ncbi:MAG: hypothetical protein HC831_09900 [Chloroflexia bacterium]|nr:hypothetical protein [Chloroflexia bacterium]